MAIYHLAIKPISRSKGRTATASAAYRAGCAITDTRTGLTFDYSKKKGVLFSRAFDKNYNELDRNELWNLAEQSENRKDSRTAREYIIAIPHELMTEQNPDGTKLAIIFAQQLAEKYDVAVDIAIHEPDKNGSDKNYHAHIMTTTRKLVHTKDGISLTDKADIELSNRKLKELDKLKNQDQITEIREIWADLANSYLSDDNKIDHRSFVDRNLDIAPTVKLGWRASAMERDGIKTDRGDINRQIKSDNEQIILAKNEIRGLIDERVNFCKRVVDDCKQRVESNTQRISEDKQTIEQLTNRIIENERRIEQRFKRINQNEQRIRISEHQVDESKYIAQQSTNSVNEYSQIIKSRQVNDNTILSRTAFHLVDVKANVSTIDKRTNYKDRNLNGDMSLSVSLHRAIDLFKAETHDVCVNYGNNAHLQNNDTAQRIKDFMFENIANKKIAIDYGNTAISDFMSKYDIAYNIDDLRALHDTQKINNSELDDNPALKALMTPKQPQQQQPPQRDRDQSNEYQGPSM